MKHRNPHYAGLAAILLILLFIACKKKTEDPQGHSLACSHHVNNLIKDPELQKCMYGPGSYWVCLDSLTNTYDTIAAIAQKKYFGSIFDNKCDSNEVYDLALKGFDSRYAELQKCRLSVYPDKVILSNDNNPRNVLFVNSRQPGFHDSLFIYNRWYKNVYESGFIKFSAGVNNYPKTIKINCFFSTAYGFLRNDIYDPNDQLIARKFVIAQSIIH